MNLQTGRDTVTAASDAERVGVLSAIGSTPLVRLDRLLRGSSVRLFAKLEGLNPGGSIKDRPALNMLLAKIRSGELVPGRSVVVESSSGNLGIGLAQVCRWFGLRFICVVDAKTTQQNRAVLAAYEAEVDVVERPDADSGEYLPARLRRVHELLDTVPHAFWPNQYANPLNATAHETTMREIVEALDGRVDYLFVAAGSCGTVHGCSRFVRDHDMDTRIVAVDAEGSAIFGRVPGPRLIPGHGASLRPALHRDDLADEVVHVSDLDCVVGCRRLVSREAVLAGGSSGAIVTAVDRVRERIPAGANCVMVLPDRGERYLDTIYSDSWVHERFGEVTHLWKEHAQC